MLRNVCMIDLYGEIQEEVKKAQNILLISHRRPDADTLGAIIALQMWCERLGKGTKLACVDKPSRIFKFMPRVDQYVDDFDLGEHDLIIIADAGASYMTNFHLKYPEMFDGSVPIINIDHHPSNDNFGKINLVDPRAASATVVVYRLMKALNVNIDEDMATCLLAGVYSDTGSFMHSNTSQEVYAVAADLVELGGRMSEIAEALFRSNNINKLKMWGKVLEKAVVTDENVVMSVIQNEDYEAIGGSPDHLSGVIDYLNMVPGSKFAVLVNEDRKGNVKGSFRTRQNDIDLSRVAAVFGGGGHAKASGFMMEGRLERDNDSYKIVSEDLSKTSLDF